jgi:hypothetical protein
MNERLIPEAAYRDKDAVEMLRVWIAEKRLHCSIKVGMYAESTSIDEAKAWGTILADAARHIANALHEGYGQGSADSLQKIQAQMNAELDAPRSPAEGKFVKRH